LQSTLPPKKQPSPHSEKDVRPTLNPLHLRSHKKMSTPPMRPLLDPHPPPILANTDIFDKGVW